jgi:hypothetical protein
MQDRHSLTASRRIGMADDAPIGELSGGDGGSPWFMRLPDHDLCVAITDASGSGPGWFRTDHTLDPASLGWERIDPAAALRCIAIGRDQGVLLTAAMLATCLNEHLGYDALYLADVLIANGFDIAIAVVPTRAP